MSDAARATKQAALSDALCAAAELDVDKWWKATVNGFFDRVRKHLVIAAIAEVKPGIDRAKLDNSPKKDVLERVKRAFKARPDCPFRCGSAFAR